MFTIVVNAGAAAGAEAKVGVLINVVAPQTNLSRSCKVLVKSVGKGFQGSIAQVKGFQIEANRLASPPLKTNCGPHNIVHISTKTPKQREVGGVRAE